MPDVSKGLSISRTFTSEGAGSPFDTVVWERRDAVIKGMGGKTIFEQLGVEFPASWSVLATNVVASKYFYGDVARMGVAPEDGGRESSLRQLIHRVTRTIADWGIEGGYFASKADGERFYDELTYCCLHQVGAFNSPVWFNVGLHQQYGVRDTGGKTISGWNEAAREALPVDPYERPQASACFIISVEDSIDDIWQLMGESARLFKYGSGVGADWSKLRSSHEKLSGGGIPSGPVSFMKVQDATGGTIKSGGKTRRAAIMQTLKVWHPDVMEFITAKQEEEKKAWALIEQGYDGSFNGPAYGSVAFQNVNQSVRLDDAFMQACADGADYGLRAITSGEVVETADATAMLRAIGEGTHICGDPGVQYEDTIQRWHTCKNSGPINSSNPCSEYMFVDDSACNLASLNLRTFQRTDGSFDVERYRAASRLFITAMDILVDNAGYPSKRIAENSHRYRPLGLGFANLGALLMSMGLAYDSDEGRSVAAALMAIEHCEAYARSAEIAGIKKIGPFEGFEGNREPMLEVMRMHQAAVADIHESCPAELRQAAQESADRMVTLGERHGYRNAQATVLAPTGTIAFMMDCDTTGIEPDIALVKYKLLAGKGEGMLKIVNQTVPQALQTLGYTDAEAAGILAHIDAHDTIEGAPALRDEHLSVFDCAFKPFNGTRAIGYRGHVLMMAACQPFISGAISKTVNLPETATVEEIMETYAEGWRLGLKAVAIYRENSKRSQPLSTKEGGNTKGKTERLDGVTVEAEVEETERSETVHASGDGAAVRVAEPVGAEPVVVERIVEREVEKIVFKPVRTRLPDERPSVTHKFSIAGHEGYLHIGLYPESRMPGEIFVTMAKQGSTISGLMDAFATSISIALQYGVPLGDLVSKFSHMRFEPSGFTNNRSIPVAKSLMDYIFRYLGAKFLDAPVEADAGVAVVPTRSADAPQALGGPISGTVRADAHPDLFAVNDAARQPVDVLIGGTVEQFLASTGAAPTPTSTFQNQADSPPCYVCGTITVRAGACYACPSCGASNGCG